MYTPDLLTMTDGTPVTSSAQWEARRGELLNILAREQYGTFLPPSTASARVMAPPMPACAGHALQETLEVRFDTPAGEFAFPLRFLYPADGQVHPLFLLLNFRPLIPDIYCPAEEILDNGFALAVVCYTDITADDGDWGSGLCGHYPRKHPDTDPGKLVFWAYAASRALDVLTFRPEVDARNIAVIGHSRLGKAALLCGAQDTRIRFTCANRCRMRRRRAGTDQAPRRGGLRGDGAQLPILVLRQSQPLHRPSGGAPLRPALSAWRHRPALRRRQQRVA